MYFGRKKKHNKTKQSSTVLLTIPQTVNVYKKTYLLSIFLCFSQPPFVVGDLVFFNYFVRHRINMIF